MFISDKLIFIELHKTGCTHIGKLLSEFVKGRQLGKHNPATSEFFTQDRLFLGSIRNPWEWYVSLWSYGCDKEGAVHNNVTCPKMRLYGHEIKSLRPLNSIRSLYNEFSRDAAKWRCSYSDSNDAYAFRNWLRMVNEKETMLDLGEGYGLSEISKYSGLLTYRYIKLFCRNNTALFSRKQLTDIDSLKIFEETHCYITHFIRNESLGDDFIKALISCGITMSDNQKKKILSMKKTNTSSRNQALVYYYDKDTVEIVKSREKLIIDKFGYTPPTV